jgi:hypothetical protein
VNAFPPVTYVSRTGNKYVIMSNKGNNKITEHDLSLSWLGIGISVESGGVKLGSSPTKPLPDFTIYKSNTTGVIQSISMIKLHIVAFY